MIVTRTVKLKLSPTAEQAARIEETSRQFALAFNAVVHIGWKAKRINGVDLHHATYHTLRQQLPLPSQLVCNARGKAVEALKSARALLKQGRKVSCPTSSDPRILFDARVFRMDWEACVARFTVIGGRIVVPFVLDPYGASFVGLTVCTAEIVKRRRGWFLHVVTKKEVPDPESTGKVIGVDRGVNRPAVTSMGKFLGDPRWRAVEERMLSLRKGLQAKGTRSAKKHLNMLSGHLARFRRDCDHVLAKRLVESVSPGDTLALETLTHIRMRGRRRGRANRRRLHAWSFARLGRFLEYKAALRGVRIAYVDARDTSRRCPNCGYIDAKNRRTQASFRCVRCAYERNADLVGSWNIRDRHEGLWSPVSEAPGSFNDPNVGAHAHVSCNPPPSGVG